MNAVQRGGWGLVCFLVVAWVLTAGCQHKGKTEVRGPDLFGMRRAAPAWRPRPERMRVYPASRFTSSGAHIVLEARVEMIDAMNDPIKAAGRFRIELLRKSAGLSRADEKLYSWDVALLSLDDQKQYYDPVTRTYLFRLKMDEQLLPRQDTVLNVTFMPLDGDAMSADGVMKAEK